MSGQRSTGFGTIIFYIIALFLGANFAFAAVQGDYGLFRRAEVKTQTLALSQELATLQALVDRMENLTLRLSDTYLDIDLLDQQARDVLGVIRADEVVVR